MLLPWPRGEGTFQSSVDTGSPGVNPGRVSGPQDALLFKEHVTLMPAVSYEESRAASHLPGEAVLGAALCI